MTSTPEPQLLAGRRGLVLGVSGRSSIGYACARRFRELGAELALSHRPARRELGVELAEELGCDRLELDVLDERSVERAFSMLGERFGRLDFLLHTVVHVPDGVLSKSVLEVSAEEFAAVMGSSVHSLLVACRYALPWLERSSAPRVVTLLSSGGALAIPSYHVVGMAKAALESAVRYLGQELGPKGILCNAVSFSMQATAAAERAIGKERTTQTLNHLQRRSMTGAPLAPEHVSSAIAFFVSSLCQNVTGETLTVDGGFTHNYF